MDFCVGSKNKIYLMIYVGSQSLASYKFVCEEKKVTSFQNVVSCV